MSKTTREELLKEIAELAYNVGFGAKKHFATFEVAEKVPGWVGYAGIIVGIYGLINPKLTEAWVSATLLVSAVAGILMSMYDRPRYEDAGKQLTASFYKLRTLYGAVKALPEGSAVHSEQAEFVAIRDAAFEPALSKQIFLSDWFAHYKFFWQHQIGWIDEQLHFGFFRDKVPLSAWLFLVAIVVLAAFIATKVALCS